MNRNLLEVLDEAGYGVASRDRDYRPRCRHPEVEIKFLKPINIPTLLELGRHDLGFCGLDWVKEQKARVDILLELGLDPVRLVVAAPRGQSLSKLRRRKQLVLATEYVRLAGGYLKKKNIRAYLLRTAGTTEVYPPDDADLIVDNTATGSTLRANGLEILDTLMTSSTCLIANRDSLKDPWLRRRAEDLGMLLTSVLLARRKVMLEMNVADAHLDKVLKILPAMKAPTLQPLAGGQDFAVKTVVEKEAVAGLLPRLKKLGVSDIVEMKVRKAIP
jgi:ATP phosphoribosyltransferase